MLSTFDRALWTLLRRDPWTNAVGWARTLLASGLLVTLALNENAVLFHPTTEMTTGCDGISKLGLFCLARPGDGTGSRWIAIMIVLITATGWRPRVTALPFWWVAFSVANAATVVDGGDQITAALALILVPIGLTDRRRWHWDRASDDAAARPYASLIAWTSLGLLRLQVFGVYLTAAIGKLGVAEWVDGTAIYYYFTNPIFGSFGWWRPLLGNAVVVSAFTWGTILLELTLASGLIWKKDLRKWLLWSGIVFHLLIAVILGLPTFALAMTGALILYLRAPDEPFAPRFARRVDSESEGSVGLDDVVQVRHAVAFDDRRALELRR